MVLVVNGTPSSYAGQRRSNFVETKDNTKRGRISNEFLIARKSLEKSPYGKKNSRKQSQSRQRSINKKKFKKQEKKKRPWISATITFLYFIIVECIILVPLHFIQSCAKSYTSRAQSLRTEQRYINIMNSTESLNTWFTAASYLDNHRGMQKWKNEIPKKEYCDAEGLIQDEFCARLLSLSENERAMGDFLRSQLHRTAHGLTGPYNYRYYTSTIRYVEDYNDAIVKLIRTFARSSSFLTEEEIKNSDKTLNIKNSENESEYIYKTRPSLEEAANFIAKNSLVDRPQISIYHSSLLRWAYKEHLNSEIKFTNIEKLKVLQDTLRSYGRSALMLSGGSTLGVYHTGVVRALFEAKLLPDIISGSSAGSIIAAIICTKTEDQLREFLSDSIFTVESLQLAPFDEGGIFTKLRRLFHTGAFMEVRTLMESLRANMGDLTFAEAYHKTGRILNVCVTSDQYSGTHMDRHMLLNYLTSPHVVVWSAVSASCALPGLFTAVQLIEKLPSGTFGRFLPGQLWCDGSVARDLPRESLAALFNVNYFIVSQVNPHIIPFLRKPPSPLVYKTWRPRKIFSALWYGVCKEMRHWILKLYDIGILSKTGLFDIPYFFLTQRYDGDVVIFPIGNVLHAVPDYFNIIANPSQEYIAYVTSRAQLRTWPHLNQIRHATMIERALIEEIALLK